jgi:hypothetical protein
VILLCYVALVRLVDLRLDGSHWHCRGGDPPDDIWSRSYSKSSVAISSAFTRELFRYSRFIMAVCLSVCVTNYLLTRHIWLLVVGVSSVCVCKLHVWCYTDTLYVMLITCSNVMTFSDCHVWRSLHFTGTIYPSVAYFTFITH